MKLIFRLIFALELKICLTHQGITERKVVCITQLVESYRQIKEADARQE